MNAAAEILEANRNTEEKPHNSEARKEAQRFIREMKEIEIDRVELAKNSEKRAWKVAAAFGVIALLSVGAVISLAPLKTSVPFLVRVDNSTGYTDLVPQLDKVISQEEAETRYNLAKFVQMRESYNFESISNNYTHVQLMSDNVVFSDYDTYIKNKKTSPLYVFKDNQRLIVKVNNVTLLNDFTAQVRFTKGVKNRDGKVSQEYDVKKWIATITFDFGAQVKTTEELLINPHGFRVTSYQVDKEAK